MSEMSEVSDRIVRGIPEDQGAFEKEKNLGLSPSRNLVFTAWMVGIISGQDEKPEDVVLASSAVADMTASYSVNTQSAARVEQEARREEARKGEPLAPKQQDRVVQEESERISQLQVALQECGELEAEEDFEEAKPTGPEDTRDPDEPAYVGEAEPPTDGPVPTPGGGEPENTGAPGTAEAPPSHEETPQATAGEVDEGPVLEVEPAAAFLPLAPPPVVDLVESGVLGALPLVQRRRHGALPPTPPPSVPSVPKKTMVGIRRALAAAPASSDARVFEEITKLEGQIQDMTQILNELKATVLQSSEDNRQVRYLLQAEAVKGAILPEVEDEPEGDEFEPGARPARVAPTTKRSRAWPTVVWPTWPPQRREWFLVGGLVLAIVAMVALVGYSRNTSGEPVASPASVVVDRASAGREAAQARALYLRSERRELLAVVRLQEEGTRWLDGKRRAVEAQKTRFGLTEAQRAQGEAEVREAERETARWAREAVRAKANLAWVKAHLPE